MYNKNFDTAPNTNITPRDVSRALRRKRFGNFCARHYGFMTVALVLAALMLVSVGCQMAEDFAGGLAHITGTETEPPSAFTPTVTPEAETAVAVATEPDTKPTVIMQEVPMETETPAEPVDPNAAHKNTDAEIEAIAVPFGKKMLNGGYKPEKHKDSFLYATACNYDDWYKPDKTTDQWIYEHVPLNIFVRDMGNVPSKFKTSKELVEEIGEEKMKEYSTAAAYFSDNIASVYPKDMTYEKQHFLFKDCGLPEAKAAQYAQEKVDYYNAHNYKRECCIRWGDFNLYRAVNGNLRSRFVYYAVIREASDAYAQDAGFNMKELGKWIYFPAEVEILTDANGNILDMHLLQLSDALLATAKTSKILEKWLKG